MSNIPNETDDLEPVDAELDDESTESTYSAVKPWDPKKIRITTKTFTLREVVDQINDGDIDLAPDFQREYVWKDLQKTRLIESLLLGIPLPAFYFNQEADGSYQVVDGVQRLTTIRQFMNDQHALGKDDLEYLKSFADQRYEQLDGPTQKRLRTTQIVVHVIEPQTPEDVKFDIFGRVNTLGSPLSAQEIRHAMSRARSRTLLHELTELKAFDIATSDWFWKRVDGGQARDGRRMANRELALRFCAFRLFDPVDYRRSTGLDAFLVEFTKRIDGRSELSQNLTENQISTLQTDFSRAMENAAAILGKAAFRKWPLHRARRGPINRAVFEAQAIALSDHPLEALEPKAGAIVLAFRTLFGSEEYVRAVTQGTGDPGNIMLRLQATRDALAGALA